MSTSNKSNKTPLKDQEMFVRNNPVEVYKIDVYPANNNSFRVDREESWILKKDKVFNDLKSAKQYIIDKSRIHTDLNLFLVDIRDEITKEHFVEEFCFDSKYLKHQRYFIGKPDIKLIQRALEDDGVQFIKDNSSKL
jgi:hypothetical protein